MDEDKLALLVWKAMTEFGDLIRAQPIQIETISVYRPGPSGASHQSLSRPKLNDAVSSYQAERMKLPEAKKLMDYLWEHGAHPMTITRDDRDPDQEGWASLTFHQIVAQPLWRLWHEYSVRSLSSTGVWDPWEVPERALELTAREIASIEVGKGTSVIVTVPLLQLEIDNIAEYEVEPGITLCTWTQEDRAVYLDRNGHYYPFDDFFGPYNSSCYVKIVANYKEVFRNDENQFRKLEQALEDFVGTIMARVKWAIMQATTPTQLICELPATVEVRHNTWAPYPIRRQGIRRRLNGLIKLDVAGCQSVAKLLSMFGSASKEFPDLRDVIWMFDRATLAALPRDILLEATIGLERLLVDGSGDIRRRFRTYGAALIADNDPTITSKNLNNIYDLRSKAAHGGDENPLRFESLSVAASTYLAGAIANVVRLVSALKIQPLTEKERINKAIERYLMSFVYTGIQEDLDHASKY
ncbi:MAG: hypothetical protein ACYDA4_11700 [Ignavibacteriaceae bacterium]